MRKEKIPHQAPFAIQLRNCWEGLLADPELEALGADSAVARIDEALVSADQATNFVSLPFLHRLRGDILLKRNPPNIAPAEHAYRTAIAIAKRQGARSYELLASLSLAKLHHSAGRLVEAPAVLGPALEGFLPAPEMPEIAEAQALLASLSETDEAKAAEAQRQRRLHLQMAYGNALIATRGYGAPETTQAFARARESAAGTIDAPERLAVDYGLWAGSFVRGELPSMRTHAAAFLSGVEARPDSPEAGVAHRAAGITHWFAGEYHEAREHLERAVALFQPVRDDDLAFRFGHDAGVGAMLYLAIVLWPMGDVERAISLVGGAEARIAGHQHIGTHATGIFHAAMFELMRGDLSRAASYAAEHTRLAREDDLRWRRAFGVFLEGRVKSRSSAPADGLADMRRGVELLREQNFLLFDGLVKLALAEAELHCARGKTLLKRDPANSAPAEGAFLTAIAVAKQQGTRSFELRAALSLAKLYRSINRPAEAHAVLAPALEGFSPSQKCRKSPGRRDCWQRLLNILTRESFRAWPIALRGRVSSWKSRETTPGGISPIAGDHWKAGLSTSTAICYVRWASTPAGRNAQTAVVPVLMRYSRLAPEDAGYSWGTVTVTTALPVATSHLLHVGTARKLDCFLPRELGKFFRASPRQLQREYGRRAA